MQGQAAADPAYREAVQRQVERLQRNTPYHSLRLPDGTVIPGLISIEALDGRLAGFPIPASLAGKRVLDVGAASGGNSFAMALRGAAVTAVDCVEFEELSAFKDLFTPPVDYQILDVDELSPETVGTFDYVLFFGVLYHLRHPLLALEKICSLTRETAFVESFVSDPIEGLSPDCSMEFYEIDELGGQIDNWCGPTTKCLMALCRAAGFVRVTFEYFNSRRAGVTCHRHWEPEPDTPSAEPIRLLSAVNNRTNDIYFHPNKDEYVIVYFRSAEAGLTRENLRIEVDGFGVNALVLGHRKDDEWQVSAKLPPGIAPGEHTVRLRTAGSRFGNSYQIVMGRGRTELVETGAQPGLPPRLRSIENSLDGTPVFHGYSTERLCCRFTSEESALQRFEVEAGINDRVLAVAFLTELGNGVWDANIALPPGIAAGSQTLRLRIRRGDWSEPLSFAFQG
jgi:tRNA (mo5U34)-methyltransferase